MAAKKSPIEKASVKQEFDKLPANLPFSDRCEKAFEHAGIKISRAKLNGKYYPCFFPWLGALSRPGHKLPPPQSTDSPAPAPTHGRGKSTEILRLAPLRAGQAQDDKLAGGAVGHRALPTDLTLDDILAALAEMLAERILANVTGSLGRQLATATVKLAPPPVPRSPTVKVDLDKPETLDDATLRVEINKARLAGNIGRFAKLVAVRRKRDEAGNSVEFHSAEA